MKNEGYNGWSNYQTWAVNLWIGNDEGTYNYWREQAANVWENAEPYKDIIPKIDVAKRDLADLLKNEISDSAPDLGASMYSDLLNSALSDVDWYEIAGHMIDEEANKANK